MNTLIPEIIKRRMDWRCLTMICYWKDLIRSSLPTTLYDESSDTEIPEWIKSNAGWWATGEIDDDTFVGALQYLIERCIKGGSVTCVILTR